LGFLRKIWYYRLEFRPLAGWRAVYVKMDVGVRFLGGIFAVEVGVGLKVPAGLVVGEIRIAQWV
jgi:hypothetical protein